jgi:hypothetical protein
LYTVSLLSMDSCERVFIIFMCCWPCILVIFDFVFPT